MKSNIYILQAFLLMAINSNYYEVAPVYTEYSTVFAPLLLQV